MEEKKKFKERYHVGFGIFLASSVLVAIVGIILGLVFCRPSFP